MADLSGFDKPTLDAATTAAREYAEWLSDTTSRHLSPFEQQALVHQFATFLGRSAIASRQAVVPLSVEQALQAAEMSAAASSDNFLIAAIGDIRAALAAPVRDETEIARWHDGLAAHSEQLSAKSFDAGDVADAEAHALRAKVHRDSASFIRALSQTSKPEGETR